jgi:hypothetical protein
MSNEQAVRQIVDGMPGLNQNEWLLIQSSSVWPASCLVNSGPGNGEVKEPRDSGRRSLYSQLGASPICSLMAVTTSASAPVQILSKRETLNRIRQRVTRKNGLFRFREPKEKARRCSLRATGGPERNSNEWTGE